MSVFRSPELRGILGLVLVIVMVGGVLAAATGKLEQWFGITIFSGPKVLDKIIFVSGEHGRGDISVMNPDGSGRTRLTENMGVFSLPSVSPSGSRILFVGRFENQDQVFAVGARGGLPDRLTSATGPKRHPSYSPDGKRLSFIAGGKVYVAELNGDSPEPVLPTKRELHAAMSNPLARNQTPAYSDYRWRPDSAGIVGVTRDPEGSDALAFLNRLEGPAELLPLRAVVRQLLKDSDSSLRRIRSDELPRVSGIGWASDENLLAVSVTTRRDSFLLVFQMEDGRLEFGGFRPFQGQQIGAPGLSPDGSEMAIAVRSIDGKASDGLLRVDMSSGAAQIIAGGVFENPSYSPRGDMIVATILSDDGRKRDVVTIDPSSGDVKRLTSDGKSFDAIWSPVSGK